jgi:uncharacterized membrane protein
LTESIYPKSSTNTIFDGSSPTPVNRLLLVLVVVLFSAARLWRLTASCLWFDEIFSVHAAEHPWGKLMHFVAADLVHPPLFYLLLKVWIGICGESLLWLRMFPALTSIAAIPPFILFLREVRLSLNVITLSLFLLAVNGYLIKYSQEVRMYSLLFFFSVCSLWLFVSFRDAQTSRRRLVALTGINFLLVYTHYYGWLFVVLEASVLLILKRSKLKSFLIGCAVLVFGYVPWMFELARVQTEPKRLGQNIGWIARPGIRQVAQLWILLNQPFLFDQSNADSLANPIAVGLMLVIFGVPLAVLFRRLLKRDRTIEIKPRPLSILIIFAFAPPVLTALLSWILPYSVWGTRHLIIAMPAYCAIVAVALASLHPYWAKVTLSLILGCWLLVVGSYSLLRPAPVFIWCRWEQLAPQLMQIKQESAKPVSVYAFEDLVAYHLWFALDRSPNTKFKINVLKNFPGTNEDPAYFLPRDFADVSVQEPTVPVADEIWLAFRSLAWNENQPPLNSFMHAGYRIGRVLTMNAQGEQAFLVQLLRE